MTSGKSESTAGATLGYPITRAEANGNRWIISAVGQNSGKGMTERNGSRGIAYQWPA